MTETGTARRLDCGPAGAGSSGERRARIVVLGVVALAMAATAARANPFDAYGVGSRSAGMASAVTAVVQDFGSVYHNPAGLAQNGGMEASFGYFYAPPTLEINGKDVDEDTTSGLVAGFVSPPMELPGGIKMSGGGLFHLPDKRVARTLAIPYDQPTYVLYGARNQRTMVMFPFCFELAPWISVGAGISLFVDSSGGPDFTLREDRPDNAGLFSEGTISATQHGRFYPVAGMLVRPAEGFRIGFDYRSKNEALYEVPIDVSIEALHIFNIPVDVLPESKIVLRQQVFSFFSPDQFTLGTAWNATDDLLLTADVTYALWSAFQQPSPEGATTYEGGLALLLGANPNFGLPPPDFHDIVIPAAGAEWRFHHDESMELFLRGGYRFRPTPAPAPKGFNNFADTNVHIIALGLGGRFPHLLSVVRGPIDIDVHGQYLHLEERLAKKNNPVADAYGDFTMGGYVLVGGATATLRF